MLYARYCFSTLPRNQVGAGTAEYLLISGVLVSALLTPFSLEGDVERNSVLQRLTQAVSDQHAAYNYSAKYPATLNLYDVLESARDIADDVRSRNSEKEQTDSGLELYDNALDTNTHVQSE